MTEGYEKYPPPPPYNVSDPLKHPGMGSGNQQQNQQVGHLLHSQYLPTRDGNSILVQVTAVDNQDIRPGGWYRNRCTIFWLLAFLVSNPIDYEYLKS